MPQTDVVAAPAGAGRQPPRAGHDFRVLSCGQKPWTLNHKPSTDVAPAFAGAGRQPPRAGHDHAPQPLPPGTLQGYLTHKKQGYLAHKKQRSPLGPPYDPRYSPTVGTLTLNPKP